MPADRAPKPNPIVDKPATVAACRADYTAAVEVRTVIAKQTARTRRTTR